MKRIPMVLAFAFVAGFIAFFWVRSYRADDAHHETLLESMPELTWLQKELDLSDIQFQKVSKLHAAYLPECAAMCERISQAHERLDKASHGKMEISLELKTAIEDHAQIHAECQERMLEHLYRTAQVLDANQAERYLEVMLPYALDFTHSEPEDAHVR